MLLAGGGHGEIVWLIMFLTAGLAGFYYPIMAFLSVDLRSLISKSIYGSLIGFNLIVSFFWLIRSGFGSDMGRPSDFQKMGNSEPFLVLFAAFAHFLPTIVFLLILINLFVFGSSLSDEDKTVSLNLN